MGVEGVGFQLDHGHGDVGAVVRHPLIVGQQVVEDKALVQGAHALLQAVHMVQLHLVAQAVHDLLQRLHPGGGLQVAGDEGPDGQVQDLGDGLLQGPKLPLGLRGEHHAFGVDLPGGVADVQGVVGNALKVGDGVQILGHLLALPLGQLLAGDLHQIGAQPVLVAVDGVFGILHCPAALVAEFVHQIHGPQQVVHGPLGHGVGDLAALFQGQGRVQQEALLQPVHLLFLSNAFGVLRDQQAHAFFQYSDKRCQHNDRGQTEQGVHQGDGHGGHGHGHEIKVGDGVGDIEHRGPDHHAQHVDQQIHKGRALAADVGPQGRQQHRHRRTDGDAHDDGQGDLKGDGPGDSQSLENTHSGAGALDDAGEQQARQNAQQGVGEGGQGVDEHLAVPQGGDGVAHGAHAVHQHREAQQDVPDVVGRGPLGGHAQDDAHHRHQARQGGGTQQGHPAAAAAETAETEDPPGDAGAQNGAHDDADGLVYLHHAGVDEAHHHHGGGGGGLDHGGDAGAQQNPLQRCAGQLIQHQLQLASGDFFQAVAHDGHAE